MKILKIVLGIILSLFTLFLLAGVFSKKVTYESEFTVQKPIEEAWAVFTDETKLGDWMDGLKSYELLEGEKNAPGSKYRIVVVQRGETMEMTETILTFKVNEQFVNTIDNDVLTSQNTMDFIADSENSTRILSKTDAYGKGILYRSIFFFMKSYFVKENEKMNSNLKKLIEENSTDYFSTNLDTQSD